MEGALPFRLVVEHPLPEVRLRIQRGHDELLAPSHEDAEATVFEFTLRVVTGREGTLVLRGPEVQGGQSDRFVYVNWGVRAGDKESRWDRRANVSLRDLTSSVLQELLQTPGAVIEARIEGTGDDGGPACASVEMLGGGWRVVRGERS